MLGIFNKPIDLITSEDVDDLVASGPAEGENVEYKQGLSGSGDAPDPWMDETGQGGKISGAARDKIVKEVIAFANAHGGTLVLGISETDERPPVPKAVTVIPRIAELAERLESIFISAIEPKLPVLQIKPVEISDGAGVLVIRVPKSRMGPHRCVNTRFVFRRTGSMSTPISMRDIQDLTLQSHQSASALQEKTELRRRELIERWGDAFPDSNQHGYCVVIQVSPIDRLQLPRFNNSNLPIVGLDGEFSARYEEGPEFKLTFPGGGTSRRPVLRGLSYQSYKNDPWAELIQYQDGRVELCMREDARIDQNTSKPYLLVMTPWLLCLIIHAVTCAHSLRVIAGSPEAELRLDLSIATLDKSKSIAKYALYLHEIRLPFDRYTQIPKLPEFETYSIGAMHEFPEVLKTIHQDFWDSVRFVNPHRLAIDLDEVRTWYSHLERLRGD